METIFRKVMCSDRLPEKNGWYFCGGYDANGIKEPYGLFKFTLSDKEGNPYFSTSTQPTWWLEEVPINNIKSDAWDEGFNEAYEFYPIYEDLPNKPTNPYK